MSTEGDRLWPEILDWMYSHRVSPQDVETDTHDREVQIRRLAEETDGEDRETVERVLEYMTDVGLLRGYGVNSSDGTYIYALTKRGFDIAHERKLREQRKKREERQSLRQDRINRSVAYLTLGLVLIGAVDTTVRAFVGRFPEGSTITLIGLVALGWIVVVAMFVAIWQSGLLLTQVT